MEQDKEYDQPISDSEHSSIPSNSSQTRQDSITMKPSLLVSCIFYLLGIGLLVPWNAFVSAEPYFSERMCGRKVELWFSLVYNISSVLSLGCWLVYSWMQEERESGQKNGSSSFYMTVMIPLALYLSVFLLTTVFVLISSISENTFFFITIFSLAICGSMNAVASAGMVASASSLLTIGPLFSGQAIGGVAVSGVNFVAALLEDPADYWESICEQKRVSIEGISCSTYDSIDWAVFVYFSIACLLLAACLMGYHYVESTQSNGYDEISNQIVDFEDEAQSTRSSPRVVIDYLDRHQSERSKSNNLTATVWSKVKKPALSIFFNFLVTLAIFPSWTSSIRSITHCQSHNRLSNDLFTPATFLFFNIFDLVGRLLAEKYSSLMDADTKLLPLSLSRFIFFLLFLLVPNSHSTSRLSPIPSDLFSFFVLTFFAVTNGFIVSWGFLTAPSLLNNEQEQLQSSRILNFAISIGLLAGSFLGIGYLHLAVSTI
mmetsp:Transcript_24643/g.36497  ORF Transcript_24643/g.36497 Transcript_24643/m.36497 type:complete len:487 (+) Transcript_24643:91-1551(+)